MMFTDLSHKYSNSSCSAIKYTGIIMLYVLCNQVKFFDGRFSYICCGNNNNALTWYTK